MKLFLVICLGLFSSAAFAGRESHGLIRAGFDCVGTPGSVSSYNATLVVENMVVTSGILMANESAVAELPCIDSWSTRNLGENLETTAFCARPGDGEFLLEFLESNSKSQLKIWKVQPGVKAALLDTLSCQ